MIYAAIIFIICYLIGAINPAIILSKKKLKTDIRELGSGNAGTTNVYRIMGMPAAILVFVLDLLKVVLAYGLSMGVMKLFNQSELQTLNSFIIGILLGHCYPIYYGLKGGKGVATMIMAVLLIDKQIAGICITVGILMLLFTQTVSKASLTGAILLPVLTFFLRIELFPVSMFVALFIILKHRSNIKRILDGTESRTFGSKKNKN